MAKVRGSNPLGPAISESDSVPDLFTAGHALHTMRDAFSDLNVRSALAGPIPSQT